LNKRQKKKYKDIQQNQIQSINQEQYDKKMNFSSLDTLFTNARTSTASTSSSYTQESIDTYLKSPYSYSDKLRVVSDYFYYKNGVYKNLINSFANFPTLDNVIIPTKGTLQKSTDKAYNTY
jgi:arginine deiminase